MKKKLKIQIAAAELETASCNTSCMIPQKKSLLVFKKT